jgi:hypothetical protein
VKAKKSFSKGDTIYRIPRNLVLTLDNSNGLLIENLFKEDKMLSSMPNVSLALFMLYLKTNSSNEKQNQLITKWIPYLNILPSYFHTPLYFTLEEIRLLQPAQCFSIN